MKYRNLTLVKLSARQRDIVACENYPIYVTSGAGCGKTQTLVAKTIEILKKDDVTLENIIIITFTNKAAEEMQSRLKTELYTMWLNAIKQNSELIPKFKKEKQAVNTANISTIHSFCEMLLREYTPNINIASNFTITSYKAKANEIISNIVGDYLEKELIKGISKNNLYKLISKLYWTNDNKGIGLLKYQNDDKLKTTIMEIYNKVVLEIETSKQSDNVITPNDLIIKTVKLLENDYICKCVSKKYKYLLMDEFQDTNFAQFELTQKLIKAGVKVFLVGDERQSIYGFRGADVDNVQKVKELLIKDSTFELDKNYRSDPVIIDYFNELFSKTFVYNDNDLRFNKDKLKASSKTSDEKPINIVYDVDILRIIDTLINHKTIRGQPIKYSDINILCRKNYMVDEIGKKVKNANIPVEIIGGRGFYKSKEVIDIFKFFNYLINKRPEYYAVLLYTDFYTSFTERNGSSFNDFMQECMDIAKNNDVVTVMDYLYENSNLFDYYESNNNYQAIANIIKLKDVVREYGDNEFTPVAQFLDILNMRTAASVEEDEAPISDEHRQRGVVSVYTIHKAKGLTMPVVVLMNIDDNLMNKNTYSDVILKTENSNATLAISDDIFDNAIPNNNYNDLVGDEIVKSLEEELRVLYVALTRAKHMIVMSAKQSKEKALSTATQSWANWINDIK